MGSVSGNSTIALGGTSGTPVSWRCHFLDVLLSKCSAMSESEMDSHSYYSCEAETSLCFSLPLSSLQRWWSSDSTLRWYSFLESSCSWSNFVFLITSWYQSWCHDNLPWALSTASSSMHAIMCGHAVQKASSIWWDGISTVGFSDAATGCSVYSQRVHSSLWVIVMNQGMPLICHDNSCHCFSNTFKAPFNLEGLSSSWMSISEHQYNGSVMWSNLMEVVLIKPWWCLVKHLCSYRYCTIWNSAEPNRITWISHDQLSCMHHGKSWGCVTPLSSRYVCKI